MRSDRTGMSLFWLGLAVLLLGLWQMGTMSQTHDALLRATDVTFFGIFVLGAGVFTIIGAKREDWLWLGYTALITFTFHGLLIFKVRTDEEYWMGIWAVACISGILVYGIWSKHANRKRKQLAEERSKNAAEKAYEEGIKAGNNTRSTSAPDA